MTPRNGIHTHVTNARKSIRPASAIELMEPYKVVNQEALFIDNPTDAEKLDWNESTQPPYKGIVDAIVISLERGTTHWYPDVNSKLLIHALSKYTGLAKKFIQTFGGSDAALEYVCRTFLDRGDEVLIAGPTYDNFRIYSESCGAQTRMHLGPSPFKSDLNGLLDDITSSTKIIYLVNPNNPTGAVYTTREIEKILICAPETILVVDEAYFEFHGETCARLVMQYGNLIVARSFSKAFGLAGLRCGYLLASEEILGFINRIRVGKNVSAPAQVGAIAALDHVEVMMRYVRDVRANQIFLARRLNDLGAETKTTVANFVMVKVSEPENVERFLRDRQIYIRNRDYLPQLKNYVRITVGDIGSCEKVVSAFTKMKPELYIISRVDDKNIVSKKCPQLHSTKLTIKLQVKSERKTGVANIIVNSRNSDTNAIRDMSNKS